MRRLLELLFGGNMLEGTIKAFIWVGIYVAVLTGLQCCLGG
jgi:hypothetical protein